jgi:hypothetical protein
MTTNDIMFYIESLSYDLTDHIDEDVLWQRIDDMDIRPDQMIKIIDWFIRNLYRDHSMPGSEYYKIISIAHWIREHGHLTDRQHRYCVIIMARYWSELGI